MKKIEIPKDFESKVRKGLESHLSDWIANGGTLTSLTRLTPFKRPESLRRFLWENSQPTYQNLVKLAELINENE